MKTNTFSAFLITAGAAFALISGAAAGDESSGSSVRVHVSSISSSTEEGAKKLYGLIKEEAHIVCVHNIASDVLLKMWFGLQECENHAVADTVRGLGLPLLTQVWKDDIAKPVRLGDAK